MTTCWKVPYPTKGEAEKDAALIAKRRKNYQRAHNRAYRCEACGAFHLTSQPNRK